MRKILLWAIVILNVVVWGIINPILSINNKPETTKSQSQSQQDNTSTAKRIIGGKLISIPTPKNWLEVSKEKPELFELFKKITLPPHRVVAAFIENTDKEISAPQFNRYALVTVSKDVENMPDLPSSDFINFKAQMKAHIKEQKDFMVKKAKEKYGTSFSISDYPYSIKINSIAPTGVFLDRKYALAQGSIVNTNLIADIELTSSYENIAVGSASLWVKGKMFNVEVKSKFETKEDMTWVKEKTKVLVDLILDAN